MESNSGWVTMMTRSVTTGLWLDRCHLIKSLFHTFHLSLVHNYIYICIYKNIHIIVWILISVDSVNVWNWTYFLDLVKYLNSLLYYKWMFWKFKVPVSAIENTILTQRLFLQMQMSKFRMLLFTGEEEDQRIRMENNFRPPQPLKGRKVCSSN